MKKKFLLILAMIMALILLISCSSDGNGTDDTSDDTNVPSQEDVLKIFGDENISYKIVRGDNAQDWEVSTAMNLRVALNEILDKNIEITTDWDDRKIENPVHYEYEILVGKTNREGKDIAEIDTDEFGSRDFLIKVDGTRVVIRAKKASGMKLAMDYFVNMVKEAVTSDNGIFTLAKDYNDYQENISQHFDIADMEDLVGICYSTWFNPIYYGYSDNDKDGEIDVRNISKILAGEQDWGGINEFHYWGKPALGYYASDDKEVIRKHFTQLSDAGVDYIIIDNTNVNTGWKSASSSGGSSYWDAMVDRPFQAILDTMLEMRAEGLKTPYIVQWCSVAENWAVIDAIYDKYYTNEEYEDCWVYWDDKPFFLTTGIPGVKNDKITWRFQWGLRSTEKDEWSFLQQSNTPNYNSAGEVEQMCVCVASQQTYMSLTNTATGREGGKTFYNQWKNAFKYRPKCITITWWNEWIAQRFEGNMFVDNYNEPYSRDIEPMEGGHGDSYYKWMCEYIRAYKAHEDCPEGLYEK